MSPICSNRLLAALLALPLLLMACGPDLESMREEAQQSLSAGQYAETIQACSQALEVAAAQKADRKIIWGLERIRLEAYARSGDGFEVGDALLRLAKDFPSQINSGLYLTLAEYLREASQPTEALEILAAGDKRFPDAKADFRAAIEDIKSESDQDEAVIEQLKKLGYL